MKNIFFLCLVILISCKPKLEQTPILEKESNSIPDFYEITSSEKIKVFDELPKNYRLDTLINKETELNYSTYIYYPFSENNKTFNSTLQRFVEVAKAYSRPYEGESTSPTSMEMWLIDYKESKELIYCQFREQTYTQGAAHYNKSILCFNYDKRNNKQIYFTDFFQLKEKEAKQDFCNRINGFVNFEDASDGYNDGIQAKELTPQLNYSVSEKQLTIYPNYCCAVEGKTYVVELDLIQEFINKR